LRLTFAHPLSSITYAATFQQCWGSHPSAYPEQEGGGHHSGRGNSATKVVALVFTALILKHSSAISRAGGPLWRKKRRIFFLHQIYEHFKTINLILDLSSFNSPTNMQSSSLCHFLHYSFSNARFQLNIVQFELSMVSRRPDCSSMMPYQRKFHAISPLISTIKKSKEKKTHTHPSYSPIPKWTAKNGPCQLT